MKIHKNDEVVVLQGKDRGKRGRVAFAFPAYHEETVTLPLPVTHDWIVYACRVAGLGPAVWGSGPRGGAWRVSATTSFSSWGENVVITPLSANVVHVRSECALVTQCLDWGKNEGNVRKLSWALWSAMSGSATPPYR